MKPRYIDEDSEGDTLPQGRKDKNSLGKPEGKAVSKAGGVLHESAASIVMTAMFPARVARSDLLVAAQFLAQDLHN